MKSYSEVSREIFSDFVLLAYRRATRIVHGISAVDGCYKRDEEDKHARAHIRCHEVARIVCGVLGPMLQTKQHTKLRFLNDRIEEVTLAVTVVDGTYGTPPREHSWLLLREDGWLDGGKVLSRSNRHILDVYAVGRLPQAQLIDVGVGHHLFYQPGRARKDIDKAFVMREIRRAKRKKL